MTGDWRLAAGGWRLSTGGWRLANEGWELGISDGRLANEGAMWASANSSR